MGIRPRLRFEILKRDRFACAYCGARARDGARLHVDHVKPRAEGGGDEPSNLVTACAECNLGKSAVPLLRRQFGKLLKDGTEAHALASELQAIVVDLQSDLPDLLRQSYDEGVRDASGEVEEDECQVATYDDVRRLLIRAVRLAARLAG